MVEILIKIDIPEESKAEFKLALNKLIKELSEDAEIQELNDDEDKIKELSIILGRKVNKSLHDRYKKLYSRLK